MLFTFGYGYVATLVATEEMARRGAVAQLSPAEAQSASFPAPASSQADVAEAA
jgi:hypothetical protein